MSALRVGAGLKADQAKSINLPGSWSVWSQAGECPGGYFLTPADGDARATGLKYVVVRAAMGRSSAEPSLAIVRTDPHKPEYLPKPKKNGARR